MQLNLDHIIAARYDNDDARQIILCSTDECDAARALTQVLCAIVDLNMQNSDEVDPYDESDYDRRCKASSFLFTLANEMTKGDREVQVFLDWPLWR